MRGTDSDAYDWNDPKHPAWADRVVDAADDARDNPETP